MTLNAFPVNNYAFLFSDLGDPFVHRNSAALTRGIVLGDIHILKEEKRILNLEVTDRQYVAGAAAEVYPGTCSGLVG